MANTSMVRLAKRVLKKHLVDVSAGVVLAVVVITIVAPQVVRADINTAPTLPSDAMVALMVKAMQNETASPGELPSAGNTPPRSTYTIPISAYNSLEGQTDSTPCIAARGFDLCAHNQENVVAANFLPIGTQLTIPELYGDRVFTVVDRMNARYYYRMDIWMREKSDAIQFGVKYATIHVF